MHIVIICLLDSNVPPRHISHAMLPNHPIRCRRLSSSGTITIYKTISIYYPSSIFFYSMLLVLYITIITAAWNHAIHVGHNKASSRTLFHLSVVQQNVYIMLQSERCLTKSRSREFIQKDQVISYAFERFL